MKRSISVFAVILVWATAASVAAPAPLTSLRAIHALSNAQAKQSLPVAFDATVTYYRAYEQTLFVQDSGLAIYVRATTNANLVPGDRVLIKGTIQPSFKTYVLSDDIEFLHHGSLPVPVPATFDELIRGQRDCMLITVRGLIRSADIESSPVAPVFSTHMQVLIEGGYIGVIVDSDDASKPEGLLDAQVDITGVVSGQFNGKKEQTGTNLYVSSLAGVEILKRAGANPWSLPVTPMDQILTVYHVHDQTQRVRVRGTVTYYQPGSAVVLQSGAKSLWIMTKSNTPLRVGDVADATGLPDVREGSLSLTRAEIHDTGLHTPITPLPVAWRQLAQSTNAFDLVSIEGQVVAEVREASQDEYVLVLEGHRFSAVYRHPNGVDLLQIPPMKHIALGSRVRVTGICSLEDSNPFSGPVPFDILIRSFDDVEVVARPSWLNIRNLSFLVGLLLIIVVGVSARGWSLERKIRRQTAATATRVEAEAEHERRMAQLEQRRSRILEDINGSRPLTEILEEITELVSFRLNDAPSWCEIIGGARLGTHPLQLALCTLSAKKSLHVRDLHWERFLSASILSVRLRMPSRRLSRRGRGSPHWPSKPGGFTPTCAIVRNLICSPTSTTASPWKHN
jgi:hypothetical protein